MAGRSTAIPPPVLAQTAYRVDADSGEIVAAAVTRKDIDDAVMADALLDQIADPIASFHRRRRLRLTRVLCLLAGSSGYAMVAGVKSTGACTANRGLRCFVPMG
jgi:hypothetical protein